MRSCWFLLLALAACDDGTLPPVRSAADPASLEAPEAPLSPPPSALGSAKLVPPTAAPAGEVDYTCPMHPEIVRSSQGACPTCGMTLTPRPRGAK